MEDIITRVLDITFVVLSQHICTPHIAFFSQLPRSQLTHTHKQ